MPGLFLSFEGIDYCGKDTQLALVRDWLQSRGHSVQCGSEPTERNAVGRFIRSILRGEISAPSLYEFQRLYVLDRAEDIIGFIRPGVQEGAVVLLSRYALSTIAYGMLEGSGPEPYLALHEQIIGSHMLWPDLTFLLDISSEEAIRRLAASGRQVEFFEKEAKLRKIRENYLTLAKRHDVGRIFVVDGERNQEEVFGLIRQALEGEYEL